MKQELDSETRNPCIDKIAMRIQNGWQGVMSPPKQLLLNKFLGSEILKMGKKKSRNFTMTKLVATNILVSSILD